jgi:hypothetical protein
MGEIKIIEKILSGWNKKMKFYCPECNNEVKHPEYFCPKCNIKLKLKVQF